jgi:hypothetical protein
VRVLGLPGVPGTLFESDARAYHGNPIWSLGPALSNPIGDGVGANVGGPFAQYFGPTNTVVFRPDDRADQVAIAWDPVACELWPVVMSRWFPAPIDRPPPPPDTTSLRIEPCPPE